ncbi:MAG: phosphatase PAP2 family protein [Clostridia bacterium]|nr:phosphatase PAP2 family protein [Clostridia bacterium]
MRKVTVLLALLILWTVIVSYVDVRPIGPMESEVGIAGLNQAVRDMVGVNFTLYNLTDLMSIIPLGICAVFGIMGLVQLLRRRSIAKVDRDILALGVFYIIVIAAFLFFEVFVINFRPVLIEGVLEASYPSSTTMLTICVMSTAAMQMKIRIANDKIRKAAVIIIYSFTLFMVVGRIISGVHWITDIIGGIILSAALVELYKIKK